MISYQKIESLDQINPPLADFYLAIGVFDGIHRGHQTLIRTAVQMAREKGGRAGVLTFYPHPSRLFNVSSAKALILTPDEKALILSNLGVDYLFEQHFTLHFARTLAQDFIPQLQTVIPRLKSIFVGEDFHFGHQRQGSVELLADLAKEYGIQPYIIKPIKEAHATISSTHIRTLLQEGQVKEASHLLGYPYFFQGPLIPGLARGRVLGFPTLNFHWHNELRLRYGVYAIRLISDTTLSPLRNFCKKEEGSLWGVANFGVKPTFGGRIDPLLEVHLFEKPNFSPGQVLRTEFFHFIRPEQKFDSVDALKFQIQQDVLTAHSLLKLSES